MAFDECDNAEFEFGMGFTLLCGADDSNEENGFSALAEYHAANVELREPRQEESQDSHAQDDSQQTQSEDVPFVHSESPAQVIINGKPQRNGGVGSMGFRKDGKPDGRGRRARKPMLAPTDYSVPVPDPGPPPEQISRHMANRYVQWAAFRLAQAQEEKRPQAEIEELQRSIARATENLKNTKWRYGWMNAMIGWANKQIHFLRHKLYVAQQGGFVTVSFNDSSNHASAALQARISKLEVECAKYKMEAEGFKKQDRENQLRLRELERAERHIERAEKHIACKRRTRPTVVGKRKRAGAVDEEEDSLGYESKRHRSPWQELEVELREKRMFLARQEALTQEWQQKYHEADQRRQEADKLVEELKSKCEALQDALSTKERSDSMLDHRLTVVTTRLETLVIGEGCSRVSLDKRYADALQEYKNMVKSVQTSTTTMRLQLASIDKVEVALDAVESRRKHAVEVVLGAVVETKMEDEDDEEETQTQDLELRLEDMSQEYGTPPLSVLSEDGPPVSQPRRVETDKHNAENHKAEVQALLQATQEKHQAELDRLNDKHSMLMNEMRDGLLREQSAIATALEKLQRDIKQKDEEHSKMMRQMREEAALPSTKLQGKLHYIAQMCSLNARLSTKESLEVQLEELVQLVSKLKESSVPKQVETTLLQTIQALKKDMEIITVHEHEWCALKEKVSEWAKVEQCLTGPNDYMDPLGALTRKFQDVKAQLAQTKADVVKAKASAKTALARLAKKNEAEEDEPLSNRVSKSVSKPAVAVDPRPKVAEPTKHMVPHIGTWHLESTQRSAFAHVKGDKITSGAVMDALQQDVDVQSLDAHAFENELYAIVLLGSDKVRHHPYVVSFSQVLATSIATNSPQLVIEMLLSMKTKTGMSDKDRLHLAALCKNAPIKFSH